MCKVAPCSSPARDSAPWYSRTDDSVKLRPLLIIAEVVVEGDMGQASSQGFQRVANYIFGNNRAKAADFHVSGGRHCL